MKDLGIPVAFIIGSPRSGTTVMGEILNNHHRISQWYEPYFIWDHFFRENKHDEREKNDLLPKAKRQITRDFLRYKKKCRTDLIIDKSPRNSLKIPFILEIFPSAKFIHILRDGRDVTLSINKEWIKRRKVTGSGTPAGQFNYLQALSVLKDWLNRQPFTEDKIRSLWFETRGHISKEKHLNRKRWNGDVGWGPRFEGWDKVYQSHSLLQFNALQWLKCIKSIEKNWNEIPEKNKIRIRYENFLSAPEATISEVLEFLKVEQHEDFFSNFPRIKKNNKNKWCKYFDKAQAIEIQSIITDKLIELGYERDPNWSNRVA